MIQALLIVTVIMTGAAAFLGNGWLQAKEQLGALNTALQAQQIEVKKAKETNDKLVKDFAAKALAHHKSQIERRFENARFNRQIASLRSKVSSTRVAAEKYPEKYARVATNILNNRLWKSCLATARGKSGLCRKFKRIKDSKAGRSSKPNIRGDENAGGIKAKPAP
tara:strand:- start:4496 stop:4993 length:498 start_codon:yes stop_codon:yes gene_type:complete